MCVLEVSVPESLIFLNSWKLLTSSEGVQSTAGSEYLLYLATHGRLGLPEISFDF